MLTGDEIITEETEIPEIVEEQAEPNEPTAEENNSMHEMIKLLQERLTIYEKAEQKARNENESGRAKRYSRGVKTLKEMLVSAQSGRNINEADIPPLLPSSAIAESTVKNAGNIFFDMHMLLLSLFIYCYQKIKRLLFSTNIQIIYILNN